MYERQEEMRKVIIESPYAGDVDRNEKYLDRCIKDSLDRGEAPFASHKMYTNALDDNIPNERLSGIVAGFAWRLDAEATVVYTDYGISLGMRFGIQAAKECNHPIEERTIGTNE